MTKQEIGAILMRLRESSGKSREEVAELLGKSVKTVGHWETGYAQPDANTLFLLCTIYDADLSTSFGFQPAKSKKPPSLSDEAQKVATHYSKLDDYGKEVVDSVLDIEYRRCTEATQSAPKQKPSGVTLNQPYTQVAAAEGAGVFLLDDGYDKVTVELNRYTQQADVILKVVGRSMEPMIEDGDRILVRQQPSVRIGEIGVFVLDGQGYLKECADDRLVSLNPDVDDVYIGDQQHVECYGKFIAVLDPEWIIKK